MCEAYFASPEANMPKSINPGMKNFMIFDFLILFDYDNLKLLLVFKKMLKMICGAASDNSPLKTDLGG